MEKKNIKKTDSNILHNWTMLCVGSSIDDQSNNLSIFGIIETLTLDLVPGEEQRKEKEDKGWYSVPFNFELITKLQKIDIDKQIPFELKYHILDPEGNKIGKEFGAAMEFPKGTDSLRIRNKIGTFPITVGGFYSIIVNMGNSEKNAFEVVGDMNFKVNLNIKN